MALRGRGDLRADPDDPRRGAIPAASDPLLVGLYITAAYWFTASTSFANPAVTLARAFTTTFAGIAMNHVPAFIVAQLVGAACGAGVAYVLFGPVSPVKRK